MRTDTTNNFPKLEQSPRRDGLDVERLAFGEKINDLEKILKDSTANECRKDRPLFWRLFRLLKRHRNLAQS